MIILPISSTVLAANGDVAGYIYSTDILAYVNDRPIESYNIGGKTAIIIKSANKVAEAHYYRMKGKAGYHRWNIQHQNKDMKP